MRERAGKTELYDAIYWHLRGMQSEEEFRRTVRDLCATYSIDIVSFCSDLCMDWSEIADLAADPLCTIGAHTVNHLMLRKVPSDATVRAEMEMSRAVLEAALGNGHSIWPIRWAIQAPPGPANFASPQNWVSRPRQRCGPGLVQGAPRLSVRAPAHRGQWRIPAATIFESADVRRRDCPVEPVPPRQRGLIFSSGLPIQLINGIAGTIQPSPAMT